MISFVWEPHARTGGGVLVSYPVPSLPAWLVMPDDRHADQLFRGGRAKKHRMRKDARLRTIKLIGVQWGGSRWEFDQEGWRVMVYALDREHLDHRDAMKEQIPKLLRELERNGRRVG